VASGVRPFGVPTAPGRPQAAAADGGVTISWVAANDMGAAVTNYLIQYRAVGTPTWTDVERPDSTATSAVVSGLSNGVAYVVRVAAVNVAGTGAWSIESNAVTPGRPATAPLGVVAVPGDASVTLSWSIPEDDGGLNITGYKIEYRLSGGIVWAQINVGNVNEAIVRVWRWRCLV
jgi:titin